MVFCARIIITDLHNYKVWQGSPTILLKTTTFPFTQIQPMVNHDTFMDMHLNTITFNIAEKEEFSNDSYVPPNSPSDITNITMMASPGFEKTLVSILR